MDARPGGRWRIHIRSADGTEYWHGGIYHEVVAPARLVFTHAWNTADGSRGPETLVTVTFAEAGGRTRTTFRQAVFQSVKARDDHRGGWTECLEKLADYVTAGALTP